VMCDNYTKQTMDCDPQLAYANF